ncbi:insulin-degrading enzyme-like [Tropilaelaps mercedesae]|uniref:Insulin-degrading enzyme-like n=1 Tax=Tropilaelaps mercedesae TaxID=418985 RepID=A0A1V9XNN3_9ACAR|nr:insulin-degrading enzyme-like [Tropilaelaps mercedesae]
MTSKRVDQIISTHSLVKSELDQCDYRGLVLKNGLRVLLISEPTTDQAAAALIVQVGSLSDPRDVSGLAHLCEHMLILGSAKYPLENHFSKFLAEHNGASNAYTTDDQTCYYFDIISDQFKEALEIFSHFFIAPLFDKSSTDREINAVDSECEKKTNDDSSRLNRLDRVTANPEHDFAKFGRGNRETLVTVPRKLGIDVRDALRDFYHKWYSANIMDLCLLGKENLDELSDIVVDLFGGIENKFVTPPEWPDHPFTEKELRIQTKVVPVQDVRRMVITFPLPDLRKHYRTDPSGYIGHLIGHEGAGSILSDLKKRTWASSLSSVTRLGARGFSFFEISFSLSAEGLEHVDDIIAIVFQYFKLLQTEGPQEWLFDELNNIGRMHFRFKSKMRPLCYVLSLVIYIRDFDWKDILSGSYIATEYKPELINELISLFQPEKLRVVLISKSFEGLTDQRERHHSIEYSVERISDARIAAWKKAPPGTTLYLPPPNEFIPRDFALAPEEAMCSNVPTLLVDEPHTRVWFLQDREYKRPKSDVLFDLRSPLVYQNPLNYCLTRMAVMCFSDAHNEFFYPIELAGSTYNLTVTTDGLCLEIHGYNQHQQDILEIVCAKLASFKVDPVVFDLRKEQYVRTLKNFWTESPDRQFSYYMTSVLAEKFWTQEQLLESLKNCTVKRCEELFQQVLAKLYVELLVHGNQTANSARKMGETVRNILKSQTLTFEETENIRAHRLHEGEIYHLNRLNDIHRTNAVMVYFQVGSRRLKNVREEAVMDLFAEILREPCFNVLRTQEQLGYSVGGGPTLTFGVYGIKVFVQSNRSVGYISSCIDTLLNEWLSGYLKKMKSKEFENFKSSLVAHLRERPKSIFAKSNRLWGKIVSRTYEFDHDELEADAVATLTKDDVMAFYQRYVTRDANELRQLVITINWRIQPDEKECGIRPTKTIEDVTEFKRKHDFFETSKASEVLTSCIDMKSRKDKILQTAKGQKSSSSL